jgi:hypothetical protein
MMSINKYDIKRSRKDLEFKLKVRNLPEIERKIFELINYIHQLL